jgi:hypothetical protein
LGGVLGSVGKVGAFVEIDLEVQEPGAVDLGIAGELPALIADGSLHIAVGEV